MIYQGLDTALCIVHPHLIFGHDPNDISGRFRRVAQNLASVIEQSRLSGVMPIAHTWMTDYPPNTTSQACLRKLRGTRQAIMKHCIPKCDEVVFLSPKTSAVHAMRGWLSEMKQQGINRIALAGYYADACVKDHAHALLRKQFKVAVIADATTGYMADSAERSFVSMQSVGIEVVSQQSYNSWLFTAKNCPPIF